MAEEKERNNKHSLGHDIGLGVTVVRALLLLILGLSLLFIPDKTHKMLFNAMGLFWLTTGIVLVRREAHAKGHRLLQAVAILGVASGVLVLTRGITTQWVAEKWLKNLLGAVILLTGVLHATTQLRLGKQALRGRPIVNILLGLAEIALGALLILTPTGREQTVYYAAMVWSLLGGGLLLVTTVLQWLRERRQVQAGPAEEQAEEQTKDQTS